MIISRNLELFVVSEHDTLFTALRKIDENKSRAVFTIDSHGTAKGVLTDGDFRRYVVDGGAVDLDVEVGAVANASFLSAPDDSELADIDEILSSRITHLPLVDERGRLTGVALWGTRRVSIGKFVIDKDAPTFVIAEVGNNHNGDLAEAKRLVQSAASAGADCVKFQLRDMKTLYRVESSGAEDLGAEYTLDLLQKQSLDPDQMFELMDYATSLGILPLCTPWDIASLRLLDEYGVQGFKLASADLTNHELLRAAASTNRPLLLSTGMSAESEIVESIQILRSMGCAFVPLHCNSTYPAPFKDINLRYLARLAQLADGPVGYSGHERGVHVAVAAVANGARVIEKHLTHDRTQEGVDHKVSLTPPEFAEMVNGIRQVEQSMGVETKRSVTQGEMMNRANLAKSLVAVVPIEAGDTIAAEMVASRSPGQGLQPNRIDDLVGRVATRPMEPGDFFFPTDIGEGTVGPRAFSFDRRWGLPARFHDVESLLELTSPDFVEFHLSYRDMDADLSESLTVRASLGFSVHSPEMFEGDFIMDLASPDSAVRDRSVLELQRVIDKTNALKEFYPAEQRPFVVANLGGFTSTKRLDAQERAERYDLLAASLCRVDTTGTELVPQTMPPFPWLRGGQLFHNLLVRPDEIVEFCRRNELRICLDTSHSKLAATELGGAFSEFVQQISHSVAYLHLVDAAGVDNEGLQVGEGEIDWPAIGRILREEAPAAPFIPEIWQGHVDSGSGFWAALDRLERVL